jgi:hypothetical protein
MPKNLKPKEKLEIKVKGSIQLGQQLELQTGDPFRDEPQGSKRRNVNTSISWVDQHGSALPHKDVDRRIVDQNLAPGQHPLSMSNDGLMLQYGVLGAPGSGKTNLLMHLLNQLIAHEARNPKLKFGGLILDPKAALIDDVRQIFSNHGRPADLLVINDRDLREDAHLEGGVNVIDCTLSPADLGEALVLGARSAGIGASEPFWLQQMSKVLGGIIALMRLLAPNEPPTLRQLLHFGVGTTRGHNSSSSNLEQLIALARTKLGSDEKAIEQDPNLQDARIALENVERYASREASKSDPKQRQIVELFMEQAFSIFRESQNACYSINTPQQRSPYDQIIESGKVLLVSPAPQKLTLSRILPSLMKLIFQRTVLSRFERYRAGELTNKDRPVLFMADEYHTVATQLEGVPFGDSEFFSQARQFGGLSIVATQSVVQLERSGLGEAWKAVFATLAAVVFMKGQDPATRQYLADLAGPREYLVRRRDHSRNEGKEGLSWSIELADAPAVPKGVLETFTRGDAVVVGTTEGNEKPTTIRYVKVPQWDKAEAWAPQRPGRTAETVRPQPAEQPVARFSRVQEAGR